MCCTAALSNVPNDYLPEIIIIVIEDIKELMLYKNAA